MIKKFLQRVASTICFGIASTNFGNAVYAYQIGPYERKKRQRAGYIDSPTKDLFVVGRNATFLMVAASMVFWAFFKK